ncbi:MAG: ATP-binding cassette domain-containing protein [Clostridia bacterium]|nr:ATP-binding cassette domain-containing protein [Clostridia bacterium]
MIEVKNLTKKYGGHTAVRDISFKVDKGIYGLLGPNGAGKSTTMNIITGCLAATSGTVLVDGHDIFEEPVEAKRRIGYLPEQPPLYMEMTPSEYLVFVANAKRVPFEKSIRQIKEVMTITGLAGVRNRLIKNLSKGYRQRVGIAQAMIGDPDTIILDEPTVGLDPKQIIEIRDLIRHLGKTKTVIISSHILAEISAVCDHILIISNGKIVADAPLAELENSADEPICIKVKCDEARAKGVISRLFPKASAKYSADGDFTLISLTVDDSEKVRSDIFFAFSKEGIALTELHRDDKTLENIFLSLTNDNYVEEADAEWKHYESPEIDSKSDDGGYTPLFSAKNEEEDENE